MLSILALEDFLRRHIQARLNTTATNISFSSEVAGKPYEENDNENKKKQNKTKTSKKKLTLQLHSMSTQACPL